MSQPTTPNALSRMDNSVSPADFLWIRKFIYTESAITLDDGKEYLITSRLTPIIRMHGFKSMTDLIAAVRAQPRSPLAHDVIDAITTNETSFFRDVHPYDSLAKDIIPALIPTRRQSKKLTIMSAACSTGQEAISIAITLKEQCPELVDWDIQIIGTDLSREVLAKAELAEYSQLEINRGMPAKLMLKYFERQGIRFKAKPEITKNLSYRYFNLNEPWNRLPVFDIIFIRNVLIYFDDNTKTRILEQAHDRMAPDGWLALGGAESMRGVADPPFTRLLHGRSVWYTPKR